MLVADTTTLILVYYFSYWIREYSSRTAHVLAPFHQYSWILWLIEPLWLAALASVGLYRRSSYNSLPSVFHRLAKAQSIGALTLLSAMYLLKASSISRLLVEIFLLLSLVALTVERTAVKLALDYKARRFGRSRNWRVLLVGDRADSKTYLRLLRENAHGPTEVMGFLNPDSLALEPLTSANGNHSPNGHSPLGAANATRKSGWHAALDQLGPDEVVATSSWEKIAGLEGLARVCRERGVIFRFLINLPPTDVGTYHVEELGSASCLVSLETIPQEPLALFVKRALDVTVSIPGLLLFALVYPFYALWIRVVSPGRVLFFQERQGQNGRRFILYKFRTMVPDAATRLGELRLRNEMNGHVFKMKDDPRLIPGGRFMRRFYLDELPQFWNVFRGEMSLVGTRPPTLEEVSQYAPRHLRRLSMKPGLTGAWQLNGNSEVRDFEEIVKLDCNYIDNWSLNLDLSIIMRTAFKVLRAEGC
jgi:exopolysaccharide biosynthesis polyprenyl glycosylphosphotransferase